MRLLLVGNFLSAFGRSRSVCEDLAIGLRNYNWQVITTSHRPGRIARFLDMTITTIRCRHQHDLAHIDVFSGPAFRWAEWVSWLLRRFEKPYVLSLHGGNLPTFAHRWGGRVRDLLTSASAVTTPSGYLADVFRPIRSDIYLLPNPVDLSCYAFRKRQHVKPRLVWVRGFHAIYNPTLAVRVVRNLLSQFQDVELTMVGGVESQDCLAETRLLASHLGIAGRLRIPGRIPKAEIPAWLNKGDIFINTSNTDNTPVSVIEAMACGLCVVSTNVGGIPYLLQHEHDALLVPPDDPEAMAAAVRRILTEPGLAEKLSYNARKKAEQFDWSHILPQWEELFQALIRSTEKDSKKARFSLNHKQVTAQS